MHTSEAAHILATPRPDKRSPGTMIDARNPDGIDPDWKSDRNRRKRARKVLAGVNLNAKRGHAEVRKRRRIARDLHFGRGRFAE